VANKCPSCHADNPDTSRFCGECGAKLSAARETRPEVTETLQTRVRELTTGSTFAGRYQIIEELGHGGMGKVYKVFDTDIKEKIALKLLRPEIAADRETVERFSNELKLARKISHRNVCRMFDLGKVEGTTFITQEFVPGEDLKKLIRKMGQLSSGRAVSIARQVCEGLAEAHRLGVVHRDLKPQNIMVDEDGNARIMDFGIARSLRSEGITGAGVIIGTPEYISPEQVDGQEADQRSDIYSLGIVLYEMLTGRVPFEGDTALSIVLKHKTEKPKNPRELNPQIPEDLNRIVLRCLEKAKDSRYQRVEDIVLELSGLEARKDGTARMEGVKKKGSIAVLPFTDLSPQKDQEYFCDGMSEELINALTKIEQLQVASRTSAFQFKGRSCDISEIGKKLKVQMVLEGSVRKAGNRLRITAQLVNAEDGYHIWSEKYDREMEDVFAIQDEISLTIADTMAIKLLEEDKAKLVKRHTEDVDAYNLYLKGRYFWNKRTEEGIKKGNDFFLQALQKDPNYALAYSGLADSFILLGSFDYLSPRETFPQAREAALRALKIDSSLPEAHASLAWIIMSYDWDLKKAGTEFGKALEFNPNYATACHWSAFPLLFMGKFDKAIQIMKQAQELDPLSLAINADLGQVFYLAQEYDKAIEQLNRTFEIDADFWKSHFHLGQVHLQKGMYGEAVSELQKALQPSYSDWVFAVLGYAYGVSGERDAAFKVLDELNRESKKRYVSSCLRALICAGLGERDQALTFLERAHEDREFRLIWLNIEPMFAGLRQDSRFVALLKKVGFDK
jgi:serine/threonine-protein kinase